MMLYTNIIKVLLTVACIGMDIIMFFLCIRLLLVYRKTNLLEAFDKAGTDLTDRVIEKTGKLWGHIAMKRLTPRGKLSSPQVDREPDLFVAHASL